MWPSTIFVQIFTLLHASIAQVLHLLYAAMKHAFDLLCIVISNIWTILYGFLILALCTAPIGATAIVELETIAWLYNLPSLPPRSEDKDKMMDRWMALSSGLFSRFCWLGLDQSYSRCRGELEAPVVGG